MKRLILLLAGTLIFAATVAARADISGPRYERANVQFNQLVRLNGVFLQGRYLFIHDADKMAKGEDCTWIYRADGRLVTSFHCSPVEREVSSQFKVTVSHKAGATDVPRVLEIQFAGSVEGHQVP
jgi:hypothetical protein